MARASQVVSVVALLLEAVWALAVLVLGSDAGITVWVLLLLTWGGAAVVGIAAMRAIGRLFLAPRRVASLGHR